MADFDTHSTTERSIINFDKYGLDEQFKLGRYSYKHARQGLEMHAHDGMMEICYFDKGLQVYEVDGCQYQIKGGDVFITFPNELHGTAHYPEEKGVLYWLLVKIPDGENFLNFNNTDSKVFLQELLSIPDRHFKGSVLMKTMLDRIFDLYQSGDQPINKLHILNQITTFLLTVIQHSGKISGRQQADRITRVKQFITANLYNNLSIDTLAKEMCISDSHFKSWFKKEIGMPPVDYILREKIDEAKKLIDQHREQTITHIAYQLNFSSSQYFATVFKKYTGMSPAEYKNRLN